MSRLHAVLREQDVACADVGAALLRHLAVSSEAPLARALLAICRDADRSGRANAYHNPAHSREVGVNWFCLALLHNRLAVAGGPALRLDVSAIVVGLCAAFGHDLGHDGRGNVDADGVYHPFWLETMAADQVAARMTAARVSAQAIAWVRCAILLTDSRCGYPILEAAIASDPDDAAPPANPELHVLSQPLARLMASLLRDADLMPSAAMPARDHDARTHEMMIELGRGDVESDWASTDAFLSDLMGARFLSAAGARFQGDLNRLMMLNAARKGRTGGLAGGEARTPDPGPDATDRALITAIGLAEVVGPAAGLRGSP